MRLERGDNDSIYVHQGVNINKGEELFNLKDKAGTRSNGYKLGMNKFRLEFGGWFLTIGRMTFWNSLSNRVVVDKELQFNLVIGVLEKSSGSEKNDFINYLQGVAYTIYLHNMYSMF